MADNDDYEPIENEYTPTPEELEAEREFHEFSERYPTFMLVSKVVTRRARLQRLRSLGAPQIVLEAEQKILDKALDALCEALPFDVKESGYTLLDTLLHFREELLRPPTRRLLGEN